MKLLKVYTPETKKVTYRGNVFDVPLWVNYMAVDSDGELIIFEALPFTDYMSDTWDGRHGFRDKCIGEVDLEGYDWKNTLEEV